MSNDTLPVTVIVPTLGRAELLEACLESLTQCSPGAGEIVVVDGGEDGDIPALVECFASAGARRIGGSRRGVAPAANMGLGAATHDTILFTHDDCVVASDWVATGARLMAEHPGGIVTGSVFPNGDPRRVPGLAMSSQSHDYTGTRERVLQGHNMGCSRRALLEIGGFDERMRPVAEDDDLAFRWLRSGRELRYAPELKVWHSAWRTESELRQVYRVYAQGDGMVYAKHLLLGDSVMARYILSDLAAGIRAELGALLLGRRRAWDHRLGRVPNLLIGLWRGIRTFGIRASRS